MGLPSYLKNKKKEFIIALTKGSFTVEHLDYIFYYGQSLSLLGDSNGIFSINLLSRIYHNQSTINLFEGEFPLNKFQIISEKFQSYNIAAKEIIKTFYKLYEKNLRIKQNTDNDDDYITTDKFVSLRIKECTPPKEVERLKKYGSDGIKQIITPIWVKEIKIKQKYKSSYASIRERDYQKERIAYIKNPELYIFKDKIYNQRSFPSSLRHYIYQRDNFTCQICGKHKSQLPKKIHLEVDHIIAWQDGGQTTLSNGQTVCSDCNKGKHHAKKYLNKETT